MLLTASNIFEECIEIPEGSSIEHPTHSLCGLIGSFSQVLSCEIHLLPFIHIRGCYSYEVSSHYCIKYIPWIVIMILIILFLSLTSRKSVILACVSPLRIV